MSATPVEPVLSEAIRADPSRGDVAARRRKSQGFAALFLAPTVIGIGLFTVIPIIASFVLAFFEWDIISPPKFVGLANFTDIATGKVGIPAVPWLNSEGGAIVMIILVYVWQNFGFSFLLFLGGLASVPKEVYMASSMDGATGWRQFTRITIPLISPTILVASVMAIIAALQIFDQPYVITRGGPGDATRTAVMVIYESAFQQLRFGRASAIGVVLTVLIMLVTALQFRLSRRFVFYS